MKLSVADGVQFARDLVPDRVRINQKNSASRMERTLDVVKAAVSEKYLGRAGIHGIGIRRRQNALTVYLHAADSAEQAALLREIEAEAVPYHVLAVTEEQPVLR